MKISVLFHDFKKTLKKLGIEGKLLNLIKGIHEKPTANIILTNKKLKDFPLKSGKKQGCSLSAFLFNIVLEVPTEVTRLEK